MYKIEKNVPLPIHKNSVYPFAEMQPPNPVKKEADSFFVIAKTLKEQKRALNCLKASAWHFRKKNPQTKFKALVVEGGVRCWRVA